MRQIDGAEYFELEYTGGDKLYVPVDKSELLEPVPNAGMARIDKLRAGGSPPPPPRSLITDRASRAAGGPGVSRPDNGTPDPLLEAAQKASPERRQVVEAARIRWIDRLIDRSRRNRLLFFRPLKVRTVELNQEETTRALQALSGEPVPVNRIFGATELVHGEGDEELIADIEAVDEADLGVVRRLQEIQKRGDEDFEERGLQTVYLAFGMASWKAEDEGRPYEAAVIMLPIVVEGRGRRISIRATGDIEINLALSHVLEDEYGCDGLVSNLEELVAETDELGAAERVDRLFKEVAAAVAGVPEFQLTLRAVIANFAFQKLAMVRDLQRWQQHMAGHDMVAAVAGDVSAKRDLSEGHSKLDPRDLDKRRPDEEFLVLDADSSQLLAINGILGGESGVIWGPPGGGKSQTIANLIPELVASGKSVLFVAEKRAALDVVKKRLVQRGLADLVLDLHSAASRKQIMAQFRSALDTVSEATSPRVEDLHRAFVSDRERLNKYVERLHRRREPSGLTAYSLFGRQIKLEEAGAVSAVRWKGDALARMTPEQVSRIGDVLHQAAAEPYLFLRGGPSPWANAELPDRQAVVTAVEVVEQLSLSLLPALSTATDACVSRTDLRPPVSSHDYEAMLILLARANSLCTRYGPGIFDLSLTDLRAALAPATSAIGDFWATLTNSGYREAKTRLRATRVSNAGGRLLLAEVDEAIRLYANWAEMAQPGSRPVAYAAAAEFATTWTAVLAGMQTVSRFLNVPDRSDPLSASAEMISRLAADHGSPPKIPAVRAYEKELGTLGGKSFYQELQVRQCPTDAWYPNLNLAWLASCIDHLILDEPELAIFNGREHDKVVDEFRRLDRERLEAAVARVLRAYGERVVRSANQYPEQHLLLRRQAGLKSRHLPFRELVRRAPDIVKAVKPCWMASPLSVSQLLEGTDQFFDVVIFDEASQVLPEDAVTSVLRGKAAVVAGDPQQLPPTQFFAADREDEERETEVEVETEGFESILEVMIAFLPEWRLEWHYRSSDERLIAFSNHYVYDDRLITFPSSGSSTAPLRHALVRQVRFADSEELSASAEVTRVVELILEHAATRPDESLGVIAMGIKHSNRIQAALARARLARTDLDAFFDGHDDERFFVKNLERVQGDERDAIVLSIGYGKDAGGKLPYRFGPLLSEGGYRRLNVAVTRAKHRMTLVSSFSHEDMDPARSNKRGVEMLRLYLQYAASGGTVFADGGAASVERNEFEIQVQTALEREGLDIVAQYGASRYRIDLVVKDPKQPGRFVLAIECDGAPYHSSPTARDRDRLRQEHLEARGWRFVRIWSTDWFRRRSEEVARVMEAYQEEVSRPHYSDVAATVDPSSGARQLALGPAVTAVQAERAERPNVPRGWKITDYTTKQLVALANWIRSDGRLRTDDELVEAMMQELGFERRGRMIEAVLRDAIQRAG